MIRRDLFKKKKNLRKSCWVYDKKALYRIRSMKVVQSRNNKIASHLTLNYISRNNMLRRRSMYVSLLKKKRKKE